ncbi:sugar transferase [Candidatus Absconditicoccus praedator]|uniref:sugar transferase n=1 Tax=Candidatus Absconditicoccus praedator TaxID=2735562 RepID=UPI001E2E700E|nr:exopolysaccharide biosynthesis polyprenyl glycosylphosphotransferase [Candidatus Absconditicoccus praedator]UFX82524.1 exopolysaccharide biosynthesis polyprenyl glycosylphosphotransferase [Candidatus Absconditicoccus praedator]
MDIPHIHLGETVLFTLLSGVVFLIIGFLVGIYELFKPIHGYYKNFLKVWFFWIIIISFLAYLGQDFIFPNGISRFILILGGFFFLVMSSLFDIFLNLINSRYEQKKPYNMLLVYSNINFFKKVSKRFRGYNIYTIHGTKIDYALEGKETIGDYDIVVMLGNFDKNVLQQVVDYTRLYNKDFYHISESFFLEDLIYVPSRIGPVLAFEYKPSPLDGWYKVIKRISDILFSLTFLFVFSWLYLVIILYIWAKDGRPIFFKSERVGRGGEVFYMYKFRSMVKNADKLKNKLMRKSERKGPLFKMEDDPRIPVWGKFLRKTSLDEIPQFINVLKGEMSVVGPRPHLQSEVENYEKWQKRLLSIKPGITGYAQIFGRDSLDFEEEAKLDLYYIQNWSLFMDVYVIVSTLKVVFSGK